MQSDMFVTSLCVSGCSLSHDGAQWLHVRQARLLHAERPDVGKLKFCYYLLNSL